MFKACYDRERFKYIHEALINSGLVQQYTNQSLIKKTGCFYGENLNVYIDTSDGVNEDLQVHEYCGRIKRVIIDSQGKPFVFFKSAYSEKWSENISLLANENKGKVVPFFKWSFNKDFYKNIFGKREDIRSKYKDIEKVYDIGYFCSLNPYDYPKPSESDSLISWSDHRNFNLPGKSRMTGEYVNHSRQKIYDKISNSKFSVLFPGKLSYDEYIEQSFKCKVILNPPGVGEYTSRMFDQSYLGNCVLLRKNSYDNGYSWKKHFCEIDFTHSDWEDNLSLVLENLDHHRQKSTSYFDQYWTPKSIVQYFSKEINTISEEIK